MLCCDARQVAEWKAAHPGAGKYPKLAGLNYGRMHAFAGLAGEEPKEMKGNRWYAWWVAYTAELGTPLARADIARTHTHHCTHAHTHHRTRADAHW